MSHATLAQAERPTPRPQAGPRNPAQFIPDRIERDAYHAELARRRDAGDATARNELVEANIPLAKRLAQQAAGQHLDRFDDLFSEACKGLIRAAEMFDPALGTFATIAHHWIKISLNDHRRGFLSLIRVPAWAQEASTLERSPLVAERRADVERALACRGIGGANPRTTSLLGQVVRPGPAVDARALAVEREAILCTLMATLPDRQHAILRLRFGLDADGPLILDAVGDRYGLSKERVRQIERDALVALRARLAERGIHSAADL